MRTSLISAHQLHKMLKITIKYETWIENIKEYGFNEGLDYIDVDDDTIMSRSMATSICIIARSPQSEKIREEIEAA